MALLWPADQPTLTGTRVILRPFRVSDHPALLRACADPVIQRFTLIPSPYLPEHASQFLTTVPVEYATGQGAHFAVTRTGEDRVVGAVGVSEVHPAHRYATIGYWVAPWARQEGLARDAVATASAWALESQDTNLNRLEAFVHPANTASQRVLCGNGFQREGTVRARFQVRDERPDFELYARVRGSV